MVRIQLGFLVSESEFSVNYYVTSIEMVTTSIFGNDLYSDSGGDDDPVPEVYVIE